jgi:hypothetical protein
MSIDAGDSVTNILVSNITLSERHLSSLYLFQEVGENYTTHISYILTF